jgi:hypothetical protein
MFQHTAPLSNYHIFRPANTGSPRWDLYDHLSRLPHSARADFEDHIVAGNLVIRVEPDLGSADERDAEAKIVSGTETVACGSARRFDPGGGAAKSLPARKTR